MSKYGMLESMLLLISDLFAMGSSHHGSPHRIRGVTVAVKMADSQKSHEAAASFQNEIAAYNDLHEAQGVCLPKLVSYGTAMYNMAQYIATSCISGLTLEQAGAVSDAQRHSAFLVRKIVALRLHEDENMSLGHPTMSHNARV